ncbi:hypothetical protein SUDANB25_01288 [Streptomyces sp. SudanB25_2051]
MSGDNRRVDATTPPPAHPEPRLAGPLPPAPAEGPARPAPPADAAHPAHAPYALYAPPPPRPLHRRLLAPLATLTGAAAAFAYVGAVDPNEPGHYPVCPLLRYTGLYCPGCGGLRSAHAFVHGDLPAALGANAMAVAGFAAFAVFLAYWLVSAVRGLPVRLNPRPLTLWLAGGVWAVFSVVRNLPFGSALAP